MTNQFKCPNCGAPNTYKGEGDTVQCKYCGSEVRPPEEMVTRATVARFSSKSKIWIILFIVVVFVLPACIGFGGTLMGIAASILGVLASIFASFFSG